MVDTISPLFRGETILVFYPNTISPYFEFLVSKVSEFFSSSVAASAFNNDFFMSDTANLDALLFDDSSDSESSLSVFDMFTQSADLAWVHLSYCPKLAKRLKQFEVNRNSSTTVFLFIATDDDIFPIVESLGFGNPESVWIVDENGILDPLRTRS